MEKIVLKNVNILNVNNGEFLNNHNLLIENGKIKDISDNLENLKININNCEVYNLEKKFAVPGIINMHQHYFYKKTYGYLWDQMKLPIPVLTTRALKNVIAELKEGITTARVMGSIADIDLSLKHMIKNNFILGPRLFISGRPLGITGSHAKFVEAVNGEDNYREKTRERVRHVDWIKVFASYDPIDPIDDTGDYARPEISEKELKVVVEEAHKAGIKVAAHAIGSKALANVINAGVDTIEHGVYLNRELARKMKEKGIALIPTLSAITETLNPIYDRGSEWIRLHEAIVKPHQNSFRIALEEGVKIGMGLDSLGDLMEEFRLMKEYSELKNLDILKICTLDNAKILGVEDKLGSIEIGKIADILILDADPSKNIASLGQISYVIKEGKILDNKQINLPTRYESKEYNSLINDLL